MLWKPSRTYVWQLLILLALSRESINSELDYWSLDYTGLTLIHRVVHAQYTCNYCTLIIASLNSVDIQLHLGCSSWWILWKVPDIAQLLLMKVAVQSKWQEERMHTGTLHNNWAKLCLVPHLFKRKSVGTRLLSRLWHQQPSFQRIAHWSLSVCHNCSSS